MTGRYQPKAKLPLVAAFGPTGGGVEIAVSGDRRTYYRRYLSHGGYQVIPMYKARELVDTMERDVNEVPERLRRIDELLIQELRNRTAEPALPQPRPRMTNWGRQTVQSGAEAAHLGLPG